MPSRTHCCWLSRSTPLLVLLITIGAFGCREDLTAPTAPETHPALANATTAALVFFQVSAGWQHTCGVTTDHRAYCWGSNSQGALGNGEPGLGSSTARPTPRLVLGGHQFTQISAGFSATCAVTTDFRAYCWGGNGRGELGDGTTTPRATPVPVAGGLRFRQLETNFEHTCGVTYPGNRVYCWGSNAQGEIGDGSRLHERLTPVPVVGTLVFRQVTAGFNHSCGVTTSNRAYCWGNNEFGQLGDSSEVSRRLKPTLVAGAHQFHQISASREHTCAVTTGARAFCWGNGRQGQVGNGKAYLSFWPKAVAGGLSFDRVTAGEVHTCGETTLNRAYCWGLNAGMLGDGTETNRLTPVAVSGNLFFSQLSAGGSHSCGRTAAGVAYCWGIGWMGQLGNGSPSRTLTPVRVVGS